jgi:hypothetical protein
MVVLKKRPKARKCTDRQPHCTCSKGSGKCNSENKTEDVLGEGQFGFRKRKGTRDASLSFRPI